MSVYKSRRKLGMKILIVLVLGAAVFGLAKYFLSVYTIKNVYVEGNYHYTEDEIKGMVMEGVLGNNSLYLSMKYRNKGGENIPFIDVMDVAILAPDTIKITVYEKVLTGYIKYLDSYMYFDKDGYMVETSSIKTMGIPQITGLSFDHAVLGEPIPVEDAGVFQDILTITKLLKKYQLSADKIYFQPSGEVTVYFGKVKVALGDESARLEDKIMLLPGFLSELSEKCGTLQMEKYNEGNGKYTFKPE